MFANFADFAAPPGSNQEPWARKGVRSVALLVHHDPRDARALTNEGPASTTRNRAHTGVSYFKLPGLRIIVCGFNKFARSAQEKTAERAGQPTIGTEGRGEPGWERMGALRT